MAYNVIPLTQIDKDEDGAGGISPEMIHFHQRDRITG